MATTPKHEGHRRRHSHRTYLQVGFTILLVLAVIAVVVTLLILMNNPTYEGRH